MRVAREKECLGCGKKVKRFSSKGVCGQCSKNNDIVDRVQEVAPKPERKERSVVIGSDYFMNNTEFKVHVNTVYEDEDEPVVEFVTSRGSILFRTAIDFLKLYKRCL